MSERLAYLQDLQRRLPYLEAGLVGCMCSVCKVFSAPSYQEPIYRGRVCDKECLKCAYEREEHDFCDLLKCTELLLSAVDDLGVEPSAKEEELLYHVKRAYGVVEEQFWKSYNLPPPT